MAPGGSERFQKDPKRFQKAPEDSQRFQEAREGSRRPQEAPGGPSRFPASQNIQCQENGNFSKMGVSLGASRKNRQKSSEPVVR